MRMMLVSVYSKAQPGTKLTHSQLSWPVLAGCKCCYCALFAYIEGSFCLSRFFFFFHYIRLDILSALTH